MARHLRNPPLTVALNGRRVGELRREPSGAIDFAYAPAWLGWEQAFPISLSLPLREERYIGEPVTAVFDNLLPDGPQIRRRVAERVGAAGVDAYSLLASIGRDCVGALQFLPDGEEPSPPGVIEAAPIDEAAVAQILANLARAPLGLGEDANFRISLAGAQEKTALLRRDGVWLKPHGSTPTTHILKPQVGHLPIGVDLSCSVENEYLCMKLTAALGLRVANVEIADFAGRRALVVERFDRRWTRDGRLLRLPQEDMCQALGVPPTRKYEPEGGPGAPAILKLLGGADDPLEDRRAFVKALTVFWLLGATDGHAKNFSLQLAPKGGYGLAPLYDIISVQPAVSAHELQHRYFKLAMALGDSRHYAMGKVQPRHIVQTAQAGGVRERFALADMRALAERCEAALAEVTAELPVGFPAAVAEPIFTGVRIRLETLQRFLEAPPRGG